MYLNRVKQNSKNRFGETFSIENGFTLAFISTGDGVGMLGAGIQVFDHINGIVGNISHQSFLGDVERQILMFDDADYIFRSAGDADPAERKPGWLGIGYL